MRVEWEVWTLDPSCPYRRRALLVRTLKRPWHGMLTPEVPQWVYTTRSQRMGRPRKEWKKDDRHRLQAPERDPGLGDPA